MVGFRLRAPDTSDREYSHMPADGQPHNPSEEHHDDDDRSIDERSIAADSWSVKSEYGSTLDGEDTRHAEVMEVMATVKDRGAEDGCIPDDEEEGDDDEGSSVLGLRSHWDATYADELVNFHEHGQPGEIWFGDNVLETSSEWTARTAATAAVSRQQQQHQQQPMASATSGHPSGNAISPPSISGTDVREATTPSTNVASMPDRPKEPQSARPPPASGPTTNGFASNPESVAEDSEAPSTSGDAGVSVPAGPSLAGAAATWRVLDVGTGNGLLLHALARHGFTDLTGSDYCEAAVELARAVAQRAGLTQINFLVDDVLETRVEGQFDLVTDKGTLDAVKLHPEGRARKKLYRRTMEKLVAPGGLLVVTSCNSTRDELTSDLTGPLLDRADVANGTSIHAQPPSPQQPNTGVQSTSQGGASAGQSQAGAAFTGAESLFEVVDHVRTYPTFRFGGSEGSRVCTVAFRRKSGSF
eukprot:TRINITY_DN3914_c0_g1_i1.p1 TRINITY_DN3914_c0_g1~~TRINITY_DN3914_c0_g1_i1.p1  ORF type:complete len:471 (-),score=83.78 TRINITY_DN3914_c0_g1_i1:2448-3860(-)